jgi:pSer/pThr/pTyr-binding forkhead associated (FHA) protein
MARITWLGDSSCPPREEKKQLGRKPLTIRLRIGPCVGKSHQVSDLQVPLARPIRLGRADPAQDIFPEVDLTQYLTRQHGVSRQHTCIFRQGATVKLEDLGSINGTLLNGHRLAPFLAETLKDGDQFQMGQFLVKVSFEY